MRPRVPFRSVRTSVETVDAYFDAMRARDASALPDLFTADAELVNAAGIFAGIDAIVGFYRDLVFPVEDFHPDPGPLIGDGDRIAVEIRVRMGGTTTEVADVFTLTLDGRISRLVIYGATYLNRPGAVTDTNRA